MAAVALVGCSANAQQAKLQTVTGYLEIASFVYGKGSHPVTVHTKSGSYMLSMWYEKKYLRYANKRVTVSGSWADFNPRGQSFRYFKTRSIALAVGETPHKSVPRRLPSPTVVRSKKEIQRLRGNWGVAFGKATYHYDPKNPKRVIAKVTVKLADGFALTKNLWRAVTPSRYPQQSKATIAFMRYRGAKLIVTPMRFCRGHSPRCGMK